MEIIGLLELYLLHEQDGDGIREICCKPVAQFTPLLLSASILCTVPIVSQQVAYTLAYGETVQLGSQGGEVRAIQVYLRNWGFPLDPTKKLAVDGIFGSQTKAAVEEFQEYQGLQKDGIIGHATYSVLSSVPNYPSKDIKLGSQGDRVQEIQTYLRNLGFPLDSSQPLAVDGIFGSKTQQAVKEFQQYFSADYDLQLTGVVDAKTYGILSRLRYYNSCYPDSCYDDSSIGYYRTYGKK